MPTLSPADWDDPVVRRLTAAFGSYADADADESLFSRRELAGGESA